MDTKPGTDLSLANLIRDLRDETTTLFRQELALARTELTEKASSATRNLAYFAIGGLIAYAGLLVLLFGVSDAIVVALVKAGINEQVAFWVGPVATGLVLAILGYVFIAKAKRALAHEGIAPKKTIESLKQDKEWVQHRFHKHETAI